MLNVFFTALVYAVFLILLLTKFNFNPAYLISLGEKFANLNLIPKNLVVWKNYGYDGQFYYRLALNPFTSKREEFGIALDSPSYRHQRIIYPLISWIFSSGQKDFLSAVLLLVNFIALLLLAFLGGLYAKSLKINSLWGLVFVIHPGFPYTLSRDLTEILQGLFLVAALILIKTKRYLFASLVLTLAVLTKETALIVVASLLLTFKNRYFLIPAAVYVFWQAILFLIWGKAPILLANLSLGPPLAGLKSYLNYVLTLAGRDQRLGIIQLCFLFVFAVSVFNSFATAKAEIFKKLSFFLYFMMALFYTSNIWVADIAFLRALTEFYILGATILISSKSKLKLAVFLLTVVVWLLSIKQFGYF